MADVVVLCFGGEVTMIRSMEPASTLGLSDTVGVPDSVEYRSSSASRCIYGRKAGIGSGYDCLSVRG